MTDFHNDAPPIAYAGGTLTGKVKIGHICNTDVCIHREFWFGRDIVSNEWSVYVELPETDTGPDGRAGQGSISVTDAAVNAFLDQLVQLIADPEAIGNVTFGPAPTSKATETA